MASDPLKLTAKVIGADDEAGAVYFTEFRRFCDSLEACLRLAESIATGRTGRVAYKVVGLGIGSATMTLEATRRGSGRDSRPRVLRLFRKTVSALQNGKGLDPRIGPDEVAVFKKLAAPLNRGSKSILLDETEITTQFIANTDKLLSTSLVQDGFVSGLLERVNVHERCEFILFPPIDGYRITCIFPESMLEQVRNALKHNVTVQGSLRYYADCPFPKLVRATSLEIHPDDDTLPTLTELRGLAPGSTGGITAAEFVKGLRDD